MRIFKLKSIRIKILLPLLSITILGLLIISASVYIKAGDLQSESINKLCYVKAQSISNYISDHLSIRLRDVEVASYSDEIRSMDITKAKSYLDRRENDLNSFEMFIISDKSGNFKSNIQYQGNIADKDYFKKVMTGQTIISGPAISEISGKPVVVIAVPVKDDEQQVVGLFAGTVEMNNITNSIDRDKVFDSDYTYLIDNKGVIISHPIKEKILKENILTSSNQDLAEIVKKMIKGKNGVGFYEYEGVKKFVGYSNIKLTDWSAAYTIKYSNYRQGINELGLFILFIGLIIIILLFAATITLVGKVTKPVLRVSEATNKVASGNFSVEIKPGSKDELGLLTNNFINMVNNIKKLLNEVKEVGTVVSVSSNEILNSASEIGKVSDRIAVSVNELSNCAAEQAASTESGSERIKNIIDLIQCIAEDMTSSEKLACLITESMSVVERSIQHQEQCMGENKNISTEVSVAVESLLQKSQEIGQILGVIKSVADQTNLLALNAAIEASRAGEYGRGFAVVADEIRNLAEQSSVSSKKISEIIWDVQEGVRNTVAEIKKSEDSIIGQGKALDETIHAFEDIFNKISSITNKVKAVSSATYALKEDAEKAGSLMVELASVAQQTAASTQEVNASIEEKNVSLQLIIECCHEINKLASQFQESLDQFKM